MDNQQLYNLKNEQLQVLLTGIFGDGCLHRPNTEKHNVYYSTNCKFEEYINYKASLLGDLVAKKQLLN